MPIQNLDMDFGLISTAVSSLVAAKDLGAAMIGVRDSNIVSGTIAQMNEQILKAQEALLTHSLQMSELQQRHFEALEKLRAMEKLIADRGSYSLHEISRGSFVYRSNFPERLGHDGNPIAPEPVHYVCQPCFDKNVKVVLQQHDVWGKITLNCSACKTEYLTT
jgi:hypothetical protein